METGRGVRTILYSALLALAVAAPATQASGAAIDSLKTLLQASKFAEAETGARALLSEVETAKGKESLETADVLDVLVESLQRGGKTRAEETRRLAERAVSIREKKLGRTDLRLVPSLKNLAAVVNALGDYDAARSPYERVLSIREKALGPDHVDVASALQDLAVLRWATGDLPNARALLERALPIREKGLGMDHVDVGRTLNSLGVVRKDMGDHAAARTYFDRAMAIFEKAYGPDHSSVAAIAGNIGLVLRLQGDFAGARPYAERSLAIREKTLGPDHPRTAMDLCNLAMLHETSGDYETARPMYERALAALEKALGPDHADLSMAVSSLAGVYMQMGDYARARPLYDRAIAISEKTAGPDHPMVATPMTNLATMLEVSGNFPAARVMYERALAISEKALGSNHADVADGLSKLGSMLARTGDFDGARPLLERGLTTAEKALGPDHPMVAECLSRLATVHAELGDYDAALPLSRRAVAIAEKAFGPENPEIVPRLSTFAMVLQARGDLVEARRLHDRALAIQEKTFGPDHPEVAATLQRIADILLKTGDRAGARVRQERAMAILEKAFGHDHPEVASVLRRLAELKVQDGDRSGALADALEAERIAREHLRLTGRALPERQALDYASVRASGLDLALTLAATGLDPDSRRRVFDAVLRSRAVVLDEMAARHHAVAGNSRPEIAPLVTELALTRERLANLAVRGPENQPVAFGKLLEGARVAKEQAERALAEASVEYARESSRTRIGLEEVAANIPARSAVVAFAVYPKVDLSPRPGAAVSSVIAFVMRSGQADVRVVDLGPSAAVDAAVTRWKSQVAGTAAGPGDIDAYRAAGEALRGLAWDPLAATLSGVQRVFVVPDGALNLVSFATLPAERGRYLLEAGPLVHYVSAERDLVSSAERPGTGLLAVGAPSYEAATPSAAGDGGMAAASSNSGGPDVTGAQALYRGRRAGCGDFASVRFAALPATGTETTEIVRLWQATRGKEAPALDLRGEAASEPALKRSAPGRRVLHLATHGFFLRGDCALGGGVDRGIGGLAETEAKQPPSTVPAARENPLLLSGLVLAGANRRASAGENDEDGILTAEEIASLDLSGVEWAVLSACETGVGDVRSGEGVFGLRRAFQVAGAGSLIMSLWSVDDEATRAWMGALYEGRLRKRLDTPEAVRHAAVTLLKSRRAQHQSTHPFYWGAFVGSGDWK